MTCHLIQFQAIDVVPTTSDGSSLTIIPEWWKKGFRDTVIVPANSKVQVIAKFTDYPGRFPFHCHVIEHEDHEMMRTWISECAADMTMFSLPRRTVCDALQRF